MKLSQLLVVAGLVGGVGYYTKQHQEKFGSDATDGEDFVTVPTAEGHLPGTVYIVAAQNCTREAAQRANRLATELTEHGIPNQRVSRVNFQFQPSTQANTMERLNQIMNGPLPIVFLDGRAASNPSLESVLAAFEE